MASGGYRKPEKPAAVSGPGKFSQRTDGKPGAQPVRPMTGGAYGEGQEMNELQSSAPMSDTQGIPAPSGVPPVLAGSGVVPMSEPTQNPDEPVTSGIDAGPGVGSEEMATGIKETDEIAKVKSYLPLLERHLDNTDVPDSVRSLYRYVRDLSQE